MPKAQIKYSLKSQKLCKKENKGYFPLIPLLFPSFLRWSSQEATIRQRLLDVASERAKNLNSNKQQPTSKVLNVE